MTGWMDGWTLCYWNTSPDDSSVWVEGNRTETWQVQSIRFLGLCKGQSIARMNASLHYLGQGALPLIFQTSQHQGPKSQPTSNFCLQTVCIWSASPCPLFIQNLSSFSVPQSPTPNPTLFVGFWSKLSLCPQTSIMEVWPGRSSENRNKDKKQWWWGWR